MTESPRVLIVEDTASLALTYAGQLEAAGCRVEMAASGAEAGQHLIRSPQPFDVILLDLGLPDGDGLELLKARPEMVRDSSVVVITADGSINRAIEAMRCGAHDFLVKPTAPERLTTTVVRAGQHRMLEREVQQVRRISRRDRFQGFVGASDAMQAVYRAVENVAASKATVFITGESGTGKEVTAEAIHALSPRSSGRLVAINCGAIPENLLESELFGHVKGAFTGALEHRDGAAREANGGTLFLDEICEMDLKLQVKLLRFLQTGTIQKVGSSRPEAVDVRVICATNRDPALEVREGRFREDLFYRLSVLPIELPPLRERGDDVVVLAQHFLERFAKEEGRTFEPLDAEASEQIRQHPWPGNVRELQNVIRRAVVMSSGTTLSLGALLAMPLTTAETLPVSPASASSTSSTASLETPVDHHVDPLAAFDGLTLAEIERRIIDRALAHHDHSVPGAARTLGLSPSTLYRKLERWAQATP